MRFVIAAVGRLKNGPERDLYERYADRVARVGRANGLGPIELVEVPEDRSSRGAQRRVAESRQLLARTETSDVRIAFDETGEAVASSQFASLLSGARDKGCGRMAFLIGGADGHDREVHAAADRVISFGRLTIPHGLVRVLVAEQIYRSTTLLSGHPYHRD